MIDAIKITSGKLSEPITGKLSTVLENLAATTIIDTTTGEQYAIFGGGNINLTTFTDVINAVKITNGKISDPITGKLSLARGYLAATSVIDAVTGE